MFTIKSNGKKQTTATTLRDALKCADNATLAGLENITIQPVQGKTIIYSSTVKKDEKVLDLVF